MMSASARERNLRVFISFPPEKFFNIILNQNQELCQVAHLGAFYYIIFRAGSQYQNKSQEKNKNTTWMIKNKQI